MPEATKELGTDNSLVIYEMLKQVKTAVDTMNQRLTAVADIPDLAATVKALEITVNDLLSNRQDDTVTLSNIGDKIIEIQETYRTIVKNTDSIDIGLSDIKMDVKGTQATLDTFVGWFTPILDDFRETAILPTLQKIHGRTEQLYTSHEEIKTRVIDAWNDIQPMLQKLENHPALRMFLGVGNNG